MRLDRPDPILYLALRCAAYDELTAYSKDWRERRIRRHGQFVTPAFEMVVAALEVMCLIERVDPEPGTEWGGTIERIVLTPGGRAQLDLWNEAIKCP